MSPSKKHCLRCSKVRGHSDHALGRCEWLSPDTTVLERQRKEVAERRDERDEEAVPA